MRIGIDFDDVVADSGSAIIEMHNKVNGTHFKKDDFKVYFFEKTWGVTTEERTKEIDEFFGSDQFKKISPMAGAVEAIKKLKSQGHELYIITGRANKDIEQTELWIEGHFPNVFTDLHFNSPSRTEEIPRKKSETCKGLGIDIFIDDSLENALDCAPVVKKVFLFEQPWNQESNLAKNVERVASWTKILESLK